MSGCYKTIAVCSTILQCLNATEYVRRYPSGDCLLIILPGGPAKSEIEKIPGYRVWDTIIAPKAAGVLGAGSRGHRRTAFRALKTFHSLMWIQRHCSSQKNARVRLVIGHAANPSMLLAVKKLTPGKVVVVDDGAVVLGEPYYGSMQVSNLTLTKRLLCSLFGLQTEFHIPPDVVEIFTSFNLSNTAFRVTANDYSLLRSEFGGLSEPRRGHMWFVGQPLYADGLTSWGTYIKWLEEIKSDHEGLRVTYCPHPKETDQDVSTICEILGWSSYRTEPCLELSVLSSGSAPAVVAGFFSSGLFNLASIFGGEIQVVAYEPESSSCMAAAGRMQKVRRVYESMRLYGGSIPIHVRELHAN